MGQRQREQVQRGCAVGTVVLLAWLCRVLPLEGLPSGLQEACGILRSLLYLSLFAGWGISLYNRTVHPQVRRLLLNVDLLMLFWILVRTLRFQLNTPPGMDRMLGYLYYAPMLGIPVLCVQLVLTVDRSERYRLSAWARMLWLPSAVLLELVLTNDLHQQVFRLQQPWNENYQYGWLFGLVVGWIVICILLAFGIIAHKSRNPRILRPACHSDGAAGGVRGALRLPYPPDQAVSGGYDHRPLLDDGGFAGRGPALRPDPVQHRL